jgi:hypothetical protein
MSEISILFLLNPRFIFSHHMNHIESEIMSMKKWEARKPRTGQPRRRGTFSNAKHNDFHQYGCQKNAIKMLHKIFPFFSLYHYSIRYLHLLENYGVLKSYNYYNWKMMK